jgi:uncharacterized membrane protein YdjX (TVP38/TMEM64 family)
MSIRGKRHSIRSPWFNIAGLLGGTGLFLAWRFAWLGIAWKLLGLAPTLESFSAHRLWAENAVLVHPVVSLLIFAFAYFCVCALCLSGTVALVAVGGALFGFWTAFLVCSLAASIGALAAFRFSRRFLGSWMRRCFPKALTVADRGLEKDGEAWILACRLVPMMSFSLVNLALGLCSIRPAKFWFLSLIGLLPTMAAYAWAGMRISEMRDVGDLLSPGMWTALCVLGLLAPALSAARRLVGSLKRPRPRAIV